jgi:hypothetical protein
LGPLGGSYALCIGVQRLFLASFVAQISTYLSFLVSRMCALHHNFSAYFPVIFSIAWFQVMNLTWLVQGLRLAPSKVPNREDICSSPEEFLKHCVFYFLEHWTMDKV